MEIESIIEKLKHRAKIKQILSLDYDVVNTLKEICIKEGLPFSTLVNAILKDYLKR